MHSSTRNALDRVDRFCGEWIEPALLRREQPLTIESRLVDDEPISFSEAVAGRFERHDLGSPWGRPWGTTWFHVTGSVEDDVSRGGRQEIEIDLGFTSQQPGFQAEGAAWAADGRLLKGISPRNSFVRLGDVLTASGAIDFYIEGASNPDVPGNQWTRPTVYGDKATSGDALLYRLVRVSVVEIDTVVEALLADARALRGLVEVLPEDSPRRAEVVASLQAMCDAVDPDDVRGTARAGRDALAAALAAPASASAHRIHAVGHAHIDSAWLWPTRETERKIGRTVGNVLTLMEEDPDLAFAFSSAQQYAWVKARYPDLYERLKERIAEGRIVPVGGMWVESDTNMVGGEALVRQFLVGMGFFAKEFGVSPNSVWLPDSFGYTGAFPQIAHLVGIDDFLTQKLSWNDTNRMPHHSFWWEGIDGTRVFTHFPPIDSYNSRLTAAELDRASRQFSEKGAANTSLAPFGYGDGGGGPNREMLAQAKRTADLEGSPRVILSTPDHFFETARAEYATAAPSWVGELYLEYHRGTYTSQQRTKSGNRRSEHLLREAELWATTAAVRAGAPYPHDVLDNAWKVVLLQQFHDILPGSSIAWVHREAEENYDEVARLLESIVEDALSPLALAGDTGLVANAAAARVRGVAPLSIGRPAAGAAELRASGDGWVLENERIAVTVDAAGHITSLFDRDHDREVIPAGTRGNVLQLFRDIPNNWEAWDIELHYRRNLTELFEADAIEAVATAADGPALRISRTFGSSSVEQLLWIATGTDPTVHVETRVEWHERQKLLKLAFPVDVLTVTSESETQFGYVSRSTHENTSWDAAQFETVAHRWVRVEEPGYGVALSNDATYGHDITRIRVGDRSATQLRVSLLRAPLFPDPDADQGTHRFHHALTVGATVGDAYAHGYELNLPPRPVAAGDASAADAARPLFGAHLDDQPFFVESVKLAEDRSGDVIVRLFEPHGARARGVLPLDFAHGGVDRVDLLERTLEAAEIADGHVTVALRPFEIVSFRIRR